MKEGGACVRVFSRRQWVAHLRRLPRRPARPIVIGATGTRVQVPTRSLGTSRRAPAPRACGIIRACNRADGGISDWTRPVDSERWHERGSFAAIGRLLHRQRTHSSTWSLWTHNGPGAAQQPVRPLPPPHSSTPAPPQIPPIPLPPPRLIGHSVRRRALP